MRWFLSKKTGGLITATCGLGGSHYGEEQTAEQPGGSRRSPPTLLTAKQPYARSAPSSLPPLAPPAKALGAKGGQAVLSGSISANISVHQRSCLHARRSYKRSPRPLLHQPKPWGQGGQAVFGWSFLANISVLKRLGCWAVRSSPMAYAYRQFLCRPPG